MYGTCCIISRLHANVIEATISCCTYKGNNISLLRISLVQVNTEIPFKFQRLQFPGKPWFSITVHKSQKQTFKEIVIDLSVPRLSHEDLYVGLSRTGSAKPISILNPNNQTRNVVYPEAFLD